MKIKTKKTMTPEEYAKYMIDKYGLRGYESEMLDSNIIDAPNNFTLTFELDPITKEELPIGSFRNGEFTVKVEEEITEDTVFKRLVYIDDYDDTVAFSNFTIRELKDNGVKEFHAYIDGEFKLIWRNGKLVE